MSEKLSFQDRTARLAEVASALGEIAEDIRKHLLPNLEAEVAAMVEAQQRFAELLAPL
jgi:hypothetical protein